MLKKLPILIIIIILFGALGVGAYAFRFKFYEWQRVKEKTILPEAVKPEQAKELSKKTTPLVTLPVSTSSQPAEKVTLPPIIDTINLAVPFTPQAPYAVWDEYHNDACEEASVLMVARFWQKRPFADPADAEEELLKIKDFEDRVFGFDKDTGVDLIARILKEHYAFKLVDIQSNITLQDLKAQVLAGRPVIIPVAGRELKNPFFKQPGPYYHMLVIKGITADGKFITHDPGTKRGADFLYGQVALFNAINDWDNTTNDFSGQKAMIVVYP